MLGLGMSDVVVFFTAVSICLIFAVIWIIKSEARRNLFKDEVVKLKTQVENLEREKFMLTEEVQNLRNSALDAENARQNEEENERKLADMDARMRELTEKIETVEAENERLNAELSEARQSLEEVYKALS